MRDRRGAQRPGGGAPVPPEPARPPRPGAPARQDRPSRGGAAQQRRPNAMEGGGGAYGAAKAGGAFDLVRFVQQPQVVARIVSAVSRDGTGRDGRAPPQAGAPRPPGPAAPKGLPRSRCRPPDTGSAPQVFALIVFACLVGDGYMSRPEDPQLYCIFNRNEDACRYGIGIGVLAFLACIFFFMVDVYFPQISNTTDRKYLVLADLGFSGSGGSGPGCARRGCHNGRLVP